MTVLFNRNVKLTVWQPEDKVASGPRVTVGVPSTGPGLYSNGESAVVSTGKTPTNGIDITDLRIQFKIEKTLQKSPNTCEITVTNLSPTTRGFFQGLKTNVELQAGYDGELITLFKGNVRWCRSTHAEVDFTTTMQIGDGDRNYQLSRIQKSYKQYTSVRTILADVVRSMGLKLPAELETDRELDNQFATGASLSGRSRDELTKLLTPYGYQWSIQNGILTILKDIQTSKLDAWEVSEQHGMIGSPAFGPPSQARILKSGKRRKSKPATMTVTTQLYPQINPGNKINLRSRVANGVFKVNQIRHMGDTHGQTWSTEIETVEHQSI